ncbi:MAG: lipoyl synthase [Deltaproteobacteria bacterium]|nr:lipoyl synthase [Deltaproteobacteria bacterium]
MPVSTQKPPWLRRRLPPAGESATVMAAIKHGGLHTVCEEAHCPNQMECYSRGTATFLLLGPSCTRRCTFCAVDKSPIHPPDPREPENIALAIEKLHLRYCVLTMVSRDDLPDGGASHIATTVEILRKHSPSVGVELLISDLGGSPESLALVLSSGPNVLNHNVETVPRLYPRIRPQADYRRSLELLRSAAAYRPQVITKSGMMLGLGETREEVLGVMNDLREAGCRLLTLGQYLAPSERHHPVIRYVPPEEFDEYAKEALNRGFCAVASAPLVRSSYRAEGLYFQALEKMERVASNSIEGYWRHGKGLRYKNREQGF